MELIKYDDKKTIETLKQTVAVNATDAEFAMFVEYCKSTRLNPFKKEIWFIKPPNGRLQMMTGIAGFHTIANRNESYDGIESGLVGKDGSLLPATYPNNDFIGAWARVHRKDRKFPVEGVAMLCEYDKKQSTWNTMKRVMINKCAESVALRKAFPQELGGLYTVEEFGEGEASAPTIAAVYPPELAPKPEPKPEPTEYSVPDITHDQRLFFEKRGCVYNTETGVWACPINLGPRLEGFRVKEKAALDAPPIEIEIPFDLKPADEIPQETPLEKAKRRAAKMTAEAA